MSEYTIDEHNNKIWYDLKSNEIDFVLNITFFVKIPDKPIFWIRPHREDGPAIIWGNGSEDYYIRGLRHREDGPAAIYPSGHIYWHLHNRPLIFHDWCKELNKSEEEISELKTKYNV